MLLPWVLMSSCHYFWHIIEQTVNQSINTDSDLMLQPYNEPPALCFVTLQRVNVWCLHLINDTNCSSIIKIRLNFQLVHCLVTPLCSPLWSHSNRLKQTGVSRCLFVFFTIGVWKGSFAHLSSKHFKYLLVSVFQKRLISL